MKRLIKFYNIYQNDNNLADGIPNFSHCSTKFEVLPYLVEDDAGPKELEALAKKLKLRTKGRIRHNKTNKPGYYLYSSHLTTAVMLTSKAHDKEMCSKETYQEWIGFITLPKSKVLKPVTKPGKRITKKQAYDIINFRELGVSGTYDYVNGDFIVVKSGWNFYTDMRLLGYDHEQFLKVIGAKECSGLRFLFS